MEILRGLFRLVPREVVAPAPPWREVLQLTIRHREAFGSVWPDGTADEIAALVAPLPPADAIRLAELELRRRDVGGRNTFAHGSGI